MAAALRASGRFSEVRVAFWKEEPFLHSAFDLVESPLVFVVPVFTSEGYFTETVLPRELNLEGRCTMRNGRRIQYCPPVGTHSAMARIVQDRATRVAPLAERALTTLVVLGHGTDRHPRSGATTRSIVEQLADSGGYHSVVAAFLDQEPTLERVLAESAHGDRIIVPFFISEGWHVGTTIPEDLASGRSEAGDGPGRVWYALPVGTHPSLTDVVADIVTSELPVPDPPRDLTTDVASSATKARAEFTRWIRAAEGESREFLQTLVSWSDSLGFEIRHRADRAVPSESLCPLHSAADARRLAASTSDGAYRSLKTSPDLPGGWCFVGLSEAEMWEVYAELYPTAPVHWYLGCSGALPVRSFEETAARQSGMYACTVELGPDRVSALVVRCCARVSCLREPTWAKAGSQPSGEIPGTSGTSDELPPERWESAVGCPAPCAFFLSEAAREFRNPRKRVEVASPGP